MDAILACILDRNGLDPFFAATLTEMHSEFSKRIMEELTDFHYLPTDYTAFADLELVSREYALQKFFEPRLDTFISKYLVIGVVEKTLENRGLNVYVPSLSNEDAITDEYYSAKEYENKVGFEFIIYDGQEIVGYRFTDILDYKAAPYFAQHLVDRIVIIDWQNIDGLSEEDRSRRTCGNYSGKIDIKGIREFFSETFSDDEATTYELFMRRVIELYQETIGISSVPKLTAPKLFEHRLDEERILISKAKDITMFSKIEVSSVDSEGKVTKDTHFGYRIIEEANQAKPQYHDLEARSKTFLAQSGILENYLSDKLYKVLVGTGDFARSFLTSEYLFEQFNENDQFDYTSVVSGYLKSVEQLMFAIALLYQDKKDISGRLYRIGPPNKKVTLTQDHVENDRISATMGNLIFFFKEYPETLHIDSGFHATLFDCLDLYLDECRNQSFHKHNNYDWDRVTKIRNNTFLMYILLLGGCNLGQDIQQALEHLHFIKDDRLERIYYWLRKNSMYTFKVKLSGNTNYLVATRSAEDSFPQFDEYGLLRNFQIKIRCTETINSPFSESQYYIIDRENIPDEIWCTTYVSEYPIDFNL